jgi:hypothetical protein
VQTVIRYSQTHTTSIVLSVNLYAVAAPCHEQARRRHYEKWTRYGDWQLIDLWPRRQERPLHGRIHLSVIFVPTCGIRAAIEGSGALTRRVALSVVAILPQVQRSPSPN